MSLVICLRALSSDPSTQLLRVIWERILIATDPTAETVNTLNGNVGIEKDFSHLKQWAVFSKIYLKQRQREV